MSKTKLAKTLTTPSNLSNESTQLSQNDVEEITEIVLTIQLESGLVSLPFSPGTFH
jgi:hypothetical protein